jgi:hypothetical protein
MSEGERADTARGWKAAIAAGVVGGAGVNILITVPRIIG